MARSPRRRGRARRTDRISASRRHNLPGFSIVSDLRSALRSNSCSAGAAQLRSWHPATPDSFELRSATVDPLTANRLRPAPPASLTAVLGKVAVSEPCANNARVNGRHAGNYCKQHRFRAQFSSNGVLSANSSQVLEGLGGRTRARTWDPLIKRQRRVEKNQ